MTDDAALGRTRNLKKISGVEFLFDARVSYSPSLSLSLSLGDPSGFAVIDRENMNGGEEHLPNPALGAAFLRMLVDGALRKTFDSEALKGCDVHDIRAEDGAVSCKVWVRPTTANMFSTMHGGCHATLIDVVSTAALVTLTGRPGVSVTLSINYLRPGVANSELEVRSRVVKYGKKLGTIVTDIIDIVSGETCVTGTHVKAMSSTEENLASKL